MAEMGKLYAFASHVSGCSFSINQIHFVEMNLGLPATTQPAKAVTSPEPGTPSLCCARYVVLSFMLCYALSFIDRQILSLLVGPMKRDLHILTAAYSAAKNFWVLFFTRMGVGAGEATPSPAAFSLIADYFPPGRLGVALSLYSMGVYFGSGLAFIVGGEVVQNLARRPELTFPILGTVVSWRSAFLVVGLPGLGFALLVRTIRGGPMFYDGTVGMRRIYERNCEFVKQLGQRWKPSPLLRRLTSENKSFREYDAEQNT
jgi:MFS family permease